MAFKLRARRSSAGYKAASFGEIFLPTPSVVAATDATAQFDSSACSSAAVSLKWRRLGISANQVDARLPRTHPGMRSRACAVGRNPASEPSHDRSDTATRYFAHRRAGYIGSHVLLQLRDAGERAVVLDDLSSGFREALLGAELVVGDVGDPLLISRVLREHAVDTCAAYLGRGLRFRIEFTMDQHC